MSESQQPHINDHSTPTPDAVPPSSGQTARDGAEPSPASQSEPPDLPYAMETVRVDPRDLERMRRGGQPQASLPVPPAQSAGPSAPEKPTVSGPEDSNAGRARETAADAPTSPGSEADDMPDAAAETVILPSGRPGPNATVGQPASEAGPAGRGRMPRHPGSGPGTADPGTSAGAAGARPVGDAYGRPGPTAPEASATTWPAPGTIGADSHGGTAGPAVAGRPPTVGPRDAGAPATGANRPDAAAPTGQAPPVSSIPTVSGPPPASRSSSATRPGTPSPGSLGSPAAARSGASDASTGGAPGFQFQTPAVGASAPAGSVPGSGPESAPSRAGSAAGGAVPEWAVETVAVPRDGHRPSAEPTTPTQYAAPAAGSADFQMPAGPVPGSGSASASSGPAPAYSAPGSAPSGPAPAGGGAGSLGNGAYPARPDAYPDPPTGYGPGDYALKTASPAAQFAGPPAAVSAPAVAGPQEVAPPEPRESLGGWMVAVLIAHLPVIGLIYLIVVSIVSGTSRRTWARALLIWQVIAIVASTIFALAGGATMLSRLT